MARLTDGKLAFTHEEIALMICKDPQFVAGQDIVCIGSRDIAKLTRGKIYKSLNGIERGVLPSSPFVTVINDEGQPYTCHASRFYQLEAFNVET